eukprot:1152235-Pelagomonas_calceolata.AAC.1
MWNECGHETQQFYWFHAAVDTMLYSQQHYKGYKGYKGKIPQSRRLTASLSIYAHQIERKKGRLLNPV